MVFIGVGIDDSLLYLIVPTLLFCADLVVTVLWKWLCSRLSYVTCGKLC